MRYQLPELTAHLVALLERRRVAFDKWNESTEKALYDETVAALGDVKKSFFEMTDDASYWGRVEHTLLRVVLPRYLRLAGEEHVRELTGYGRWRNGDLVSRAVYAGVGFIAAIIVWRTSIPDWLEPLPLAFFVVGPLIPDMQVSSAKRKYDKSLKKLVDDMRAEELDGRQYQPLGVDSGAAGSDSSQNSTHTGSRDKTGA